MREPRITTWIRAAGTGGAARAGLVRPIPLGTNASSGSTPNWPGAARAARAAPAASCRSRGPSRTAPRRRRWSNCRASGASRSRSRCRHARRGLLAQRVGAGGPDVVDDVVALCIRDRERLASVVAAVVVEVGVHPEALEPDVAPLPDAVGVEVEPLRAGRAATAYVDGLVGRRSPAAPRARTATSASASRRRCMAAPHGSPRASSSSVPRVQRDLAELPRASASRRKRPGAESSIAAGLAAPWASRFAVKPAAGLSELVRAQPDSGRWSRCQL